jgi:pimeloyl-ACP methyl ester carboxylesterase
MLAPGHTPPAGLVAWYTLVARHCHSSLAPHPLPAHLLAARRGVPCVVATGEHDTFLPPARLRGPALERLGAELRVIADAGHLVTDERPEAIAELVEEVLR